MKSLILALPLLLVSCNKKEAVSTTTEKIDSLETTVPLPTGQTPESASAGYAVVPPPTGGNNVKAFRVVEGNKITRTINADMIPLTVSDEFTNADQQFIIKILNFDQKNINAAIIPENEMMNVRFNQIKKSDGSFDGPFARTLSQENLSPGEISLIIGKSQMASGEATGRFKVEIK